MTLISKETFLALDDKNYEELAVPGWGTVRLRSLSGAGRDAYLKIVLEHRDDGTTVVRDPGDSEARLLAMTLVDEEGNLWFNDVEEGVKILREKGSGSLQRAFQVALELSGLHGEAVEAAEENLDETPSGETGSD